MTTTSDDVRSHVNSIEPALAHIRHFLDAIALITEAMEEPHAGAVNVIVHAALDHVREAEAVHETLFRLTHQIASAASGKAGRVTMPEPRHDVG